jgi:anti-sigma regulatory factor (Ser/Thr protein kinase)
LHGRGAERSVIDDLSLAASELAANVVQHGDATELWVRLRDTDPLRWTLEVVGGRTALPPHLTDPRHWVISRPDSPHGRGLGIVRTVVDEIEVSNERGGLAIRCHRRRS